MSLFLQNGNYPKVKPKASTKSYEDLHTKMYELLDIDKTRFQSIMTTNPKEYRCLHCQRTDFYSNDEFQKHIGNTGKQNEFFCNLRFMDRENVRQHIDGTLSEKYCLIFTGNIKNIGNTDKWHIVERKDYKWIRNYKISQSRDGYAQIKLNGYNYRIKDVILSYALSYSLKNFPPKGYMVEQDTDIRLNTFV